MRGVKVAVTVAQTPDGQDLVSEWRHFPQGRAWRVDKRGQLIVLDAKRRHIARFRQFVWREVFRG